MINIVLGTFFGNEGKGQCVHNLCDSELESLVIRFSGGPEVGHTVVDENGRKHCFSNFGSGSFKGCTTYWSKYCLVDPISSIKEREELRKLGIEPKIIYSPECELITPYDIWYQSLNFKNEISIRSVIDRVNSDYHLQICDTWNTDILKEKLISIQNNFYEISGELPIDFSLDSWIYDTCKYFENYDIAQKLTGFFDIVFEGSQGILLDRKHGVKPWCSLVNTTSKNAFKIIKDWKLDSYLNEEQITTTINYVCRPNILRYSKGPIFCDSFSELENEVKASDFSIDLLEHSLAIDNLYNDNNHQRIIFSHGDSISDDNIRNIQTAIGLWDINKFEYTEWK